MPDIHYENPRLVSLYDLDSPWSIEQSLAQTYRSDKRFDLIIMTGHALQVLLTDTDISATFAVMRNPLKPSGLVAFDTDRRWH